MSLDCNWCENLPSNKDFFVVSNHLDRVRVARKYATPEYHVDGIGYLSEDDFKMHFRLADKCDVCDYIIVQE